MEDHDHVSFDFRDDDKPELEVSGSGQDLVEGGDAVTFSVWLTEAPSANVTVTLTLDATNSVALTLIPSGPLTFTPSAWDESNAQTVTVTVPDNAIPEEDGWAVALYLAASGGGADGATRRCKFLLSLTMTSRRWRLVEVARTWSKEETQ